MSQTTIPMVRATGTMRELTVGVVGFLAAPTMAALGAIAARAETGVPPVAG